MTTKSKLSPEQIRDIVRKAHLYDEGQATQAADGTTAGGGQRGALADRVSREVRREYFPGGGQGAPASGPLSDLTPSQRAFAAVVALGLDRDPNFRGVHQRGHPLAGAARQVLRPGGARFNSDTAGEGAEFTEVCPTEDIWSGAMCRSELIERLGGMRPIRGKSQKIVNLSGMPTAYVTPPAEDCEQLDCRTSAPVGTRTHEHDAAKISVDICMPVELEEDSFLDLVEQYAEVAEEEIRAATENAVIRGDATLSPADENINFNGDDITLTATGQAPAFTAFDGIAHVTLVDNVANAAGGTIWTPTDPINAGAIMGARSLMRDAAVRRHWGFCDPTNLLIIADPIAYAGLVQLEDVRWADRVGELATIITGQIPFLWGIPVYMAPALDPTDSAGLIDAVTAANNIYGQIHIVNREGIRVGVHRELETIVEVNRRCDLITITLQWRLSLARRSSAATAAGIESVASIYGIAAA